MDEIKDLEMIKDLLETKQYTRLRQKLAEMNIADIAAVMGEMEEEAQLKIFRILPKSMAADVFSYLEVDDQQYIITSLTDREAANIINNLMADDAVDFLEEMPANMVKKLLANANAETRRDINHLLRYPESSAGSIMTVEYVDLKEDMTVEEAVSRIRRVGVDSETINICYVLDHKRTLVGAVTLRHLLLNSADTVIREFMSENVIHLNTLMDQEEVARQFSKYDFTAMPVVDNENRLVGIITVDDVVDILEEETTEDFERMAAIVPTEKPYLKTGIFETWKSRIPWLLLLMVSATFTGRILTAYEDALSIVPALIAFIPMLMNNGGNAGAQASVTIIRGLSLGELEYKNIPKIWGKEVLVAVFCGLTLSAAYFLKLVLLDKAGIPITLVICLTILVTVVVAKLVGCTLPLLAKRIGLDPAVMASPFISTILDALSLIVYFQIAQRILKI